MTSTTAHTTYTIKGINNDEETCSHCGRTNLKRVVWLAELDADGNESTPSHYGVDCAARLMGLGKGGGNDVHKSAKAISYADKWIAEYGRGWRWLDAISSSIAVKFNVWAWVDGDQIIIRTPSGDIAR